MLDISFRFVAFSYVAYGQKVKGHQIRRGESLKWVRASLNSLIMHYFRGSSSHNGNVHNFFFFTFDFAKNIERFHMKSRREILVFQNNETTAMLVFQTVPVGIELFSYVNAVSCLNLYSCWSRE